MQVSWNGGGGGGSPAGWPSYDLNMSYGSGGGGFSAGSYSYMLSGGPHEAQLFTSSRPHEYSSPLGGEQNSPLGRTEYSLLQTHSPVEGALAAAADEHSLAGKIDYGLDQEDQIKQEQQQPPPTYVTLPPFLN